MNENISLINNIEIRISNDSIDYIKSIKFMEKRVSEILQNKNRELIWFLKHDNIITKGRSAKKNEILSEVNIPIIETNRGGKTTYHGPGQRIVYLVINLNKRKKDIRRFINLIENSTIETLKELNIFSKTFSDRVGVWVTNTNEISLKKEKKIAAIGLRIKKWITYHGLSINLYPDLSFYNFINACGLKEYSSTSVKDLNKKITDNEFDSLYLKYFLKGLKDL